MTKPAIVILRTNGQIDEIVITENGKNQIYVRPLNNDWASQRNFALQKVVGDWVLFLDSDEKISPALSREIETLSEKYSGYFLKRLDSFWGRQLRHGETGNVKLLRLGRKNSGVWKRKVHEYWEIPGSTPTLQNPILHYPHQNIADFIAKINRYTDIDAFELKKEGKDFSYWQLFSKPVGKFVQNYILKLGFLDGLPGLVMACMMSFHSLVVRVKQYDPSSST